MEQWLYLASSRQTSVAMVIRGPGTDAYVRLLQESGVGEAMGDMARRGLRRATGEAAAAPGGPPGPPSGGAHPAGGVHPADGAAAAAASSSGGAHPAGGVHPADGTAAAAASSSGGAHPAGGVHPADGAAAAAASSSGGAHPAGGVHPADGAAAAAAPSGEGSSAAASSSGGAHPAALEIVPYAPVPPGPPPVPPGPPPFPLGPLHGGIPRLGPIPEAIGPAGTLQRLSRAHTAGQWAARKHTGLAREVPPSPRWPSLPDDRFFFFRRAGGSWPG